MTLCTSTFLARMTKLHVRILQTESYEWKYLAEPNDVVFFFNNNKQLPPVKWIHIGSI